LSDEALSEALSAQEAEGGSERLGGILVRLGHVDERQLLRALGLQLGVEYWDDIPPERLDRRVTGSLPLEFLKDHHLVPLSDGGDTIVIAVNDPLDLGPFDDVANQFAQDVRRVLCPAAAIGRAIERLYYHEEAGAEEALSDLAADPDFAHLEEAARGVEDLLDIGDRAPTVRLINLLFFQAAQQRASDIHVEPAEDEGKVRYRIDGVLYDRFTIPRRYLPALVSRLKIMASLNIAERRLPQDGRTKVKIGDREIDIRVSTIPTATGERVVLRLLDRTTALLRLSELGLAEAGHRQFGRLIRMAHGIVLVTGPTGSGKTTTLYGALSEINSRQRNILTVEDPIEYRLAGISQMQIQPKIGLTFANCLRHILRQDPDIIMVGEIRDGETAEIAIHASLTGHLVFSTLHTNDSAGAITRLLDMGIEPYLVSSSLIAIMAQRLVRLICPECRRQVKAPSEAERMPAASAGGPVRVWQGAGCQHCMETGYYGRTGIFELLFMDDEIQSMTMSRTGSNLIKQKAVEKGMLTLRADGMMKVREGLTTVEEVLRVTQDELEEVSVE